jgi:hypothetical protein
MNSLIKNIEEVIDKSINEFSILICKKYKNVDINELKNIWKKLHNNENNEEEESKCSTPTSIYSKKSDKKSDNKEDETKDKSEENKCPYVASKGKNQGSKCGAKPKINSKYCSRHSKYEKEDKTEEVKEDDKKDKTEIEEIKEVKEDTPEKKTNKKVIKKVVKKVSPVVKKVERVLQTNKDINKLWHKETKLVFETKDKDTIAIGTFDSDKIDKMDKNKQIKPLTDSDIDNCKLWNFQYDNTVIKDISKLRLKEIEEVLNELQIPRSESKKSIKSLTKELVSNKKDDESVDEKSINESVEDDIDIEDDFLEEED